MELEVEEMKRYKIDLLGLSEVKRKGNDQTKIANGS